MGRYGSVAKIKICSYYHHWQSRPSHRSSKSYLWNSSRQARSDLTVYDNMLLYNGRSVIPSPARDRVLLHSAHQRVTGMSLHAEQSSQHSTSSTSSPRLSVPAHQLRLLRAPWPLLCCGGAMVQQLVQHLRGERWGSKLGRDYEKVVPRLRFASNPYQ